ncbi:AAA family ATPase [Accumulibacter sp.]|uniref:AAA family ATPase n=1 Tax=Accumulibacter sp. TaxID=2053492 RepID=UPI0025FC504F|nr:MoxR family ATPase [Accumulibacter sp.]MCM8594976.1 MoxR family ATPase [Accumulibacter sp.]MDS4049122.1 MoxR family ATPase [Accumulibacter sp.]
MIPATVKLNSKSVFLSQPYQPALADTDELVGRLDESRDVLAAWVAQPRFPRLCPLLVGDAGVGKNRLVYELARYTDKELYILQGHEDVTAEDLTCAVRFSDDAERKMDYVLSPLATAMLRGGICFIDEIGKLRPRALAPLASVLDERRYLDSVLLGERIHAHRGFAFIAATNGSDLVGGTLPEFIGSRLRPVIEVGYPSRAEIDEIVRRRFPRLERPAPASDRLISRFWQLWRDERGDQPPSPRDTLYLFGLMLNLVDAEGAPPGEVLLEAPAAPAPPDMRHLEAAFRRLFGRKE